MTVFSSFIALKSEDKWLVLKTFFLNYYIRLILWIFPFRRVHKIAQQKAKSKEKNRLDITRLMWAVNVTSHYVFKSTCLTNALTAKIILEQHGYPSVLCIGVIKEGEFEAHAWVEYEDDVVMGNSEKEYVHLLDI